MDEYDGQENEPNVMSVVSQMTRDGIKLNEIQRFAQALRAQEYYSHMFSSRSRSGSKRSESDEFDETAEVRPTSSIPDMKKLIEASNTSLASMDSQSSFEEFFRVNLDERTPSIVMKSVFNFYDDDKDGVLSSKNFKRLLFKMGVRESDLRHFMMLLADKDNNNKISWDDFHTWVKEDQAQRWIRENDRFFTFVMIAKIFLTKHEKRKKELRQQNGGKEKEKRENDEDSDLDDEKSDKPKKDASSDTANTKEKAKAGKKRKKSEELMDSSFMEESIGEKEFLEIGKELKFNELHLQMLWKQINEFQSNEVHFHQWFRYLEPIDIKKRKS